MTSTFSVFENNNNVMNESKFRLKEKETEAKKYVKCARKLSNKSRLNLIFRFMRCHKIRFLLVLSSEFHVHVKQDLNFRTTAATQKRQNRRRKWKQMFL